MCVLEMAARRSRKLSCPCEKDPDSAMAINVASSLVNWLSSFTEKKETLLIHLSTDQGIISIYLRSHEFWAIRCDQCNFFFISVYEGVKSFHKEEDETNPVNVYGQSKVAAEKFISEKCSNFAILRSSIIFGPQTISPLAKSLPIQIDRCVMSPADISMDITKLLQSFDSHPVTYKDGVKLTPAA